MADRSRRLQGQLRDALIEGGETTGVIGFRAGLHVQRLPSGVYWYGLRRWGVLRFDGTEDDYYRYLDAFYARLGGVALADGGESADVPPSNWDPHLPPPPGDWLAATTFALTRAESEYLRGRIAERAPESLLAHLLVNRQPVADEQRFPWDVPYRPALPSALAGRLAHARNFSEVMHGAALLYNLLLAEQQAGGAFVGRYRDELQRWSDDAQARHAELAAWDRPAFWRLVQQDCGERVRGVTRRFADAWFDLVLAAPTLATIADGPSARRLVTNQEHAIKPGRARVGNPRATENWEGASGSAQLDYRWSRPVRAIVNDILGPLAAKEAGRA